MKLEWRHWLQGQKRSSAQSWFILSKSPREAFSSGSSLVPKSCPLTVEGFGVEHKWEEPSPSRTQSLTEAPEEGGRETENQSSRSEPLPSTELSLRFPPREEEKGWLIWLLQPGKIIRREKEIKSLEHQGAHDFKVLFLELATVASWASEKISYLHPCGN